MSCVILACVGMVALVGAAAAADLPPRYNPVAPPMAPSPFVSPLHNWTGLYVGINGGGAWGRSDWTSTNEFDVSGGMVGGTIGYNWQSGNWVYGLEGDIDWTDISGRTHFACSFGCKTSNSWLATVRGRVGYAYDRFLPYITGGLAVGDIRARTPGFVRRQRYQCRLRGGRRHRICADQQLDLEGGVSLRRPRRLQLRHRLRHSVVDRQRLVPGQHLPRRRQPPLLIAARRADTGKAPDILLRGFLLSCRIRGINHMSVQHVSRTRCSAQAVHRRCGTPVALSLDR